MNTDRENLWRVARTLAVVLLALVLGWAFWWHYMRAPWTRDGRVRVEVVEVAAEISGKVVDLRVQDNQAVHKGDVLFVIDPRDYQLALAQAEATLQSRQIDLQLREEDARRRANLGSEVVAAEEVHSYASVAQQAIATCQEALAQRDVAKLNLSRTVVVSPVNGYVTNLHLRIGDYATPGKPLLTVADSDSFWIAGYFEETKLPQIHIGDRASVRLMGVGPEIIGHVESFSRGIADENGGFGQGLANVDPVFTWVRLAQRIPVRIHIDRIPDHVAIAAGQTCTIFLSPGRRSEKTAITEDPRN
jgi:multidrug resistance efflux pump